MDDAQARQVPWRARSRVANRRLRWLPDSVLPADHRARLPQTFRRSVASLAAHGRASSLSRPPPIALTCRDGIRCMRSAFRLNGEIRTRHPQTVVTSGIDQHVIRRRHVAVRALAADASARMMVMRRRVVFRGEVALGAQPVPVHPELGAVRLVAIAARNATAIHLALQERAPDVNLVALLSIRVVERRFQRRRAVVIQKTLPARHPSAICARRAWHGAQTSISASERLSRTARRVA